MESTNHNFPHQPIMVQEMLEQFDGLSIDTFFEGTVGAGGHAEAMLKAHPEITRYIACDQDTSALEIAKARLEPWAGKIEFIHGNFSQISHYLSERGINKVDGFFLI